MIESVPPVVMSAFARIGLALAYFVWQAAAIAAVLAIVLWLMGKRSPGARYLTSVVALTLMTIMPVATLWYVGRWHEVSPRFIDSVPAGANRLILASPADEVLAEPPRVGPSVVEPTLSVGEPAVAESAADEGRTAGLSAMLSRTRLNQALSAAAIVWACGVVLLAVRLMLGWLSLHRLRCKNTEALSEPAASIVQQLRDRLGLQHVTVLATRAWNEPVAFGLLRPIVLVPLSVLTQCPSELIEALVAHELAHIRRYDLWVNLLQRVSETLLFYHPAVWWVSGRIRVERELCCDDLAVRITNRRAEYATALVEVSRLARGSCAPALAAGAISPRLSVLDRARRVLQVPARPPAGRRVSYWVAGPLSVALGFTIGLVAVTSSRTSAAALSATTQPGAEPRADLLRPLPESKTFTFEWKDVSFKEAVEDLSRMTGLSVRGLVQIGKAETPLNITFESVRPLAFDEALLLFDRLIEADGCWIVRREDFLDLKRITDLYRFIPPANVYTSVEAYRKADLPGWDVASVLYEPKVHPGESLASFAMDNVPNNMARAIIAIDKRHVELRGIVYYIDQQLELLERMDSGQPPGPPAASSSAGGPAFGRLGSINSSRPDTSQEPDEAFAVFSRAGRTGSGGTNDQIDIRSLAEGIVTRVHVRQGQQVKPGDLLVELDNAEIKLELEAAKLRLEAAVNELEWMRKAELALMKELQAKDSTGLEAQAILRPESEKFAREAELAKLEVHRWELRLTRTLIKAPAAGHVVHIAYIQGRKMSAGEQILVLRPISAESSTQPANRN
jgi:beta-lactamase regulating signal transducer with metallopeptidase domain/biotin carboxyl carrier protein